MALPGDERTQGLGGQGHLRASHADREQVIRVLKAAFVAGMLAKDELDLRVGQGLVSRTYAELADLTADLPAGLAAGQPATSARAVGGQPLVQPGQIIAGATLLYLGAWLYAPALAVLGAFFYVCVVAIALAAAVENRHDQRSGRQLPQRYRRGAGGLGTSERSWATISRVTRPIRIREASPG